MDMNALKVIAAKDVVVKTMTNKHFSVCDIRTALELIGKPCACQDSMLILSSVHCVDYTAMNPVIRELIPELVKKVFGFSHSMQSHIPTQIVLSN
jgi:hypothetical protein